VTNYYPTVFPDTGLTFEQSASGLGVSSELFDGQDGDVDVLSLLEDATGNNLSLFGAPQSAFFNPGEEFDDIIAAENDDDGLSGGQIAGITIGSVIAALLIIIIIVLVVTSGGQQRFTGMPSSRVSFSLLSLLFSCFSTRTLFQRTISFLLLLPRFVSLFSSPLSL
jgi:hypothetical protein